MTRWPSATTILTFPAEANVRRRMDRETAWALVEAGYMTERRFHEVYDSQAKGPAALPPRGLSEVR